MIAAISLFNESKIKIKKSFFANVEPKNIPLPVGLRVKFRLATGRPGIKVYAGWPFVQCESDHSGNYWAIVPVTVPVLRSPTVLIKMKIWHRKRVY